MKKQVVQYLMVEQNNLVLYKNLFGYPDFLSYIPRIMEQVNKINGLNERHIKQIIRRNMITRSKPSKKVYTRKDKNKKLW